MADREYWVWLQAALGQASSKVQPVLSFFGGVQGVYDASPAALAQSGLLSRRELLALSEKSLQKARETAARCDELGYGILTLDDPSYPARLHDIFAPPCALYIWGELPPSDAQVWVAVVGTRQITDYGYQAATQLSMGLTRGGAMVVSGLAIGVDGAAHKGALKAGGKTVAVIGCGLDINYPAPHAELRRLIAKNGAVVSEYPPGTRGDRVHFPLRNRIIAGLTQGTLVIEAGEKSGSLITAALATEMGRDVFAVPGSIFSPLSMGTNRLIRDGAKPVCSAPDVLEEYIGLYPHTISLTDEQQPPAALPMQHSLFSPPAPVPATPPRPKPAPPGLTAAEQALLQALDNTPRTVDELALRLNLEMRVVLAAMTALEIQGLTSSLPGRRYIRI